VKLHENYYRQTDPESTKKKYGTSRGVLSYLAQKMAYWTVKFGKLPQPQYVDGPQKRKFYISSAV
jgi:hypothetical protein